MYIRQTNLQKRAVTGTAKTDKKVEEKLQEPFEVHVNYIWAFI